MTKQNINSKKGFTIIEVVLVLAIAGLIFLMVFIAYPALRRSQSDTQRREDMSKALSQLTSYITNNRKPPKAEKDYGEINTTADPDEPKATTTDNGANFFYNYLTKQAEGFNDPSDGNPYLPAYGGKCNAAVGVSCWGANEKNLSKPTSLDHKVYYFYKAKCDDDTDNVVGASGEKEVAIAYYLESGGMYCGSNTN